MRTDQNSTFSYKQRSRQREGERPLKKKKKKEKKLFQREWKIVLKKKKRTGCESRRGVISQVQWPTCFIYLQTAAFSVDEYLFRYRTDKSEILHPRCISFAFLEV
ncbi:hypothetical protein CDAR_301021 [Caerostris darwini]|uniref:Uncharacterized protein n=1 Tax=Caerostris darwini TaxID=1538125 RepID=A0AAV4WDB1_9ARAC|nr:hypothetical protein CDAR_301021 [Caerostris darwini]